MQLKILSSYKTDISQIDWTRYYSDYHYDEFILSLLRELEPIKFTFGKLLLRQDQNPVTEVYFPMRGEIHLGYNHQKYLRDLSDEDIKIPYEKGSPIYQEVKGRITQNLKQLALGCTTATKKFQYPIV
mmetsp:Transcript_38605/g.58757  ORF Transcript_38605/g.58757 Transcript_38605/m.58757 type:complete len:128 (+) Transcript_38605:470-853(+)